MSHDGQISVDLGSVIQEQGDAASVGSNGLQPPPLMEARNGTWLSRKEANHRVVQTGFLQNGITRDHDDVVSVICEQRSGLKGQDSSAEHENPRRATGELVPHAHGITERMKCAEAPSRDRLIAPDNLFSKGPGAAAAGDDQRVEHLRSPGVQVHTACARLDTADGRWVASQRGRGE